MESVLDLGKRAKDASRVLSTTSTAQKNQALYAIADALLSGLDVIIEANGADMQSARDAGESAAILDRLMLNEERIKDMAEALRDVAKLKDPVGEVIAGWRLENGLKIEKVRVPLGVIGIIYEARPNVTVDAAALCLKTGNAVILRGSASAYASNVALVDVIAAAVRKAGLPDESVQLVRDKSREAATEMMGLYGYIDVLIPRGGAGLINSVVQNSKVPVIETGIGNCHVYVDKDADLEKATPIIINAKCQRPGVCNAAETLIVHRDIAADYLPRISEALTEKGVELVGDAEAMAMASEITAATEDDFYTEFLDLKMAVKVAGSLDEAIAHINKYGSMHSEAIITEDYTSARRFTDAVDAAAVYVNASTRFTDGGQFGFGAEIGISTQKLHARGPMALPELTSTKYVITGDGQTRA